MGLKFGDTTLDYGSVRGNGESTTKRHPRLEHPGRSGARPKPLDWIVRGRTRCRGLERPRQRREYNKKTPRIGASRAEWSTAQALGLDRPWGNKTRRTGASGAEWSAAQAPGLDRPGGNLGPRTGSSEATERIRQIDAPDWSIRGGQEQGPDPRTGSFGGAPGAADWNIRGRNAPGLDRPRTKRPGNGMSGATNKEKETAAERHKQHPAAPQGDGTKMGVWLGPRDGPRGLGQHGRRHRSEGRGREGSDPC